MSDKTRGLYRKYTVLGLAEGIPCFAFDLTPGHDPFVPAGLGADVYDVERTDGKSEPGQKHHGCKYHVVFLPTVPPEVVWYKRPEVIKLVAAARAYKAGRSQSGRIALCNRALDLQASDRAPKVRTGGDPNWEGRLRQYAMACAQEYPALAKDIYDFIAGNRDWI